MLKDHITLPCQQARTFLDCLAQIEKNTCGVVFFIDEEARVLGLLTDGDIRRAFLQGCLPSDDPSPHINRQFSFVEANHSRERLLKWFDQGKKFIPVLAQGRLVDLIFPQTVLYQENKDILARAKSPVRISFGGGGTDLTAFFSNHGGAVLNATINLYAHCVLRKRADSSIVLISHDFQQEVRYPSLEEVVYDKRLDLIKAAIQLLKPSFGFELEIFCDFPPHSGLGGSSAVLSAVISCFNEFREDKLKRHEIAELAFQAERIELSVTGGWQDQYATVFGGFNFIEFNEHQNEVFPLKIECDVISELEARLVLCYSGQEHPVGTIHDQQIQSLREPDKNRSLEYAHRMKALAYGMKSSLLRAQLDCFGNQLHEGWELKKGLSQQVSSAYLDDIYEFARTQGAVGGKIVGAGGGGFFLFQAKIDKKGALTAALKQRGLLVKDFIFDDRGVRSWKMRFEP